MRPPPRKTQPRGSDNHKRDAGTPARRGSWMLHAARRPTHTVFLRGAARAACGMQRRGASTPIRRARGRRRQPGPHSQHPDAPDLCAPRASASRGVWRRPDRRPPPSWPTRCLAGPAHSVLFLLRLHRMPRCARCDSARRAGPGRHRTEAQRTSAGHEGGRAPLTRTHSGRSLLRAPACPSDGARRARRTCALRSQCAAAGAGCQVQQVTWRLWPPALWGTSRAGLSVSLRRCEWPAIFGGRRGGESRDDKARGTLRRGLLLRLGRLPFAGPDSLGRTAAYQVTSYFCRVRKPLEPPEPLEAPQKRERRRRRRRGRPIALLDGSLPPSRHGAMWDLTSSWGLRPEEDVPSVLRWGLSWVNLVCLHQGTLFRAIQIRDRVRTSRV